MDGGSMVMGTPSKLGDEAATRQIGDQLITIQGCLTKRHNKHQMLLVSPRTLPFVNLLPTCTLLARLLLVNTSSSLTIHNCHKYMKTQTCAHFLQICVDEDISLRLPMRKCNEEQLR